ncbi:hypothetical protein CEXT_799821 [Caerostris extrusa]|uniref:Uncharacterized protein n=1 Tax=Caerostris extrusa TaxID=172846 RepID=A0AAV4U037_CAEEX|nr:hypothetical protein CEXT_799821 [Caerostris extrusa]
MCRHWQNWNRGFGAIYQKARTIVIPALGITKMGHGSFSNHISFACSIRDSPSAYIMLYNILIMIVKNTFIIMCEHHIVLLWPPTRPQKL